MTYTAARISRRSSLALGSWAPLPLLCGGVIDAVPKYLRDLAFL